MTRSRTKTTTKRKKRRKMKKGEEKEKKGKEDENGKKTAREGGRMHGGCGQEQVQTEQPQE